MIDESDARRLALDYINRNNPAGHSFRVLGVNKRVPRDWTVLLQAIPSDGAVLTGTIILVVDEETGSVRTFNEAFAAGWRAE